MQLILQIGNSPNIDIICGAIAYAVHKKVPQIYCNTAKVSEVVKKIIKDYASPVGIEVSERLPENLEEASVVLLGNSTDEAQRYIKLTSDTQYQYITNLNENQVIDVNPPNIGVKATSLCEVLYKTYPLFEDKDMDTDHRRILIDLIYLGLASANDRYLAVKNKQVLKIKNRLEEEGAQYETAVRYLINIVSRHEMSEVLPSLAKYEIAGRDGNVGIVSLPSGKNKEQYEYVTSVLQDVANLTIAIVLVEGNLSIPMVYVRSIDSYFTSEEILGEINGSLFLPRNSTSLTVSSVLNLPDDNEDAVAYVQERVNALYNRTRLIDGLMEVPPSQMLTLHHKRNIVHVLDLYQFTDDVSNISLIDNKNKTSHRVDTDYYEVLNNGSLLPIDTDTFHKMYKITYTQQATQVPTTGIDISIKTDHDTITIDGTVLKYLRKYDVLWREPIRAIMPFEDVRIHSPLTGTIKARGMLDIILLDTLTVIDATALLQTFDIK